ncbi:MAG: Type 1 glutamine amidotransferase-like domain-containing protein [Parcubacteria group bacterium]|jgi:peptidase E
MTKYILNGGMTRIPCESNDNFFKEIITSVKKPVKVLLVFFAAERKRWPELEEEHKEKFFSRANGKKIEFGIASVDVKKFIQQVGWCDVVYIRGGLTPVLQKQLEKVPNFKDLIKNKIVAGSSAGALVFAKYYYEQDYDKIFEGLGYLPVKMITHYLCSGEYAATSGKDKLKILENYKEKLPIYAIPETEFIIVEK